MNIVADEQTSIEILYRNRSLRGISVAEQLVQQYNAVAEELELEPISSDIDYGFEFNIPQQYKDIDVEEYVRSLAREQARTDKPEVMRRVENELSEYKARNLYPVLQLMIYIVDTMRKNNLVWGVGRGSSVASYVLYLIGVHKIDSIKYDLDIREFIK